MKICSLEVDPVEEDEVAMPLARFKTWWVNSSPGPSNKSDRFMSSEIFSPISPQMREWQRSKAVEACWKKYFFPKGNEASETKWERERERERERDRERSEWVPRCWRSEWDREITAEAATKSVLSKVRKASDQRKQTLRRLVLEAVFGQNE
jgi:hypothetical protein